MNNRHSHRRLVLLTFALLLLGLGLACFVWVKIQQRQHALNRQLIEALKNGNTKEALALVESGADPNTRYEPTPVPSLSELMDQMVHRSPPIINDSPTALMIACGANGEATSAFSSYIAPLDPHLIHAMLLAGVNVNAKAFNGYTALYWAFSYQKKDIIKELLINGANVHVLDDKIIPVLLDTTTDDNAEILALLRKYSKH